MTDKDIGRLVIDRKPGTSFTIGDDITIRIDSIRGFVARLSISAPRNMKILRNELTKLKE